ncbi:MAG: hypothetical protein U9N10_02005 [Bacillota bacterium]|nr:hypothetical protein [Bacillota bacterium]
MVEKRMLRLIIFGIILASILNIISNYFVGYPFSIDIKWIILIIINTVNREKMLNDFENFKQLHDKEKNRLKDLKKIKYKLINSFGI